jgi:hypothetical protein
MLIHSNRAQGTDLFQRGLLLNLCVSLFAASVMAGCALMDGILPSPNTQPGLEGRVIDAATRTRLAGAKVTAQGISVLTITSGQYWLPGLQKGSTVVVVSLTGYADLTEVVTITGTFTADTGNWHDPKDFELLPLPKD